MYSLPLIGKHIFTGLRSFQLNPEEAQGLSQLQPLGVVLFARNFSNSQFWQEDLKTLIKETVTATQGSLKFVSIDFEGGRVNRFPESVKRFPYPRDYKDSVRSTTREMAKILTSLGINLSFSPCVDIDVESSNPVIGPRSFSHDPQEVVTAARIVLNEHNQQGIHSCLKHFPGHGRSKQDSHFTLPEVIDSRITLEDDLIPYQKLLSEFSPMIMCSHVLYTELDNELPSSLSFKIVNGLLRDELQFSGLVLTDDLDMKALTKWTHTEKCHLAIMAGVDVLLFGNGMDGNAVRTSLRTAEELLEISEKSTDLAFQLEASSQRIDKYLCTNKMPLTS